MWFVKVGPRRPAGVDAGPRGGENRPGATIPRAGAGVDDLGDGIGEFGEACGLRGPWGASVARGDAAGGPSCAMAAPFALIGRDPRADVVLDHPEVDRAHAYIQVVGGRAFCVDLGSRGGTRWADGPRPMGWVGPGESIAVGPYRVTPELPRASSGGDIPPTSRSFPQGGAVEASLEFLDPAAERASWRVSRSLVLVGRSTACKVRLGSPAAARFHCGLVRTPAGLWVVDLLGRAGTHLRGRPRRASKLADGDLLRLGDQEIRVRLGPAEFLPARRPAEILSIPAAPPAIDPAALLREFGLMQQQMADQFQQALLMMFQMFSGMHQEQMALIREEMARLHQLSTEQGTLQARLAERPAPAPRPADAPRPPADPDPYRLHADLVGRLASIQQERQTRWQRLIGTLTSRAEEVPSPG